MIKIFVLFSLVLVTLIVSSCLAQEQKTEDIQKTPSMEANKTEEDWQKTLTPEQYRILRQKGTEAPGTGKYNLHFDEGTYFCAGCNSPLFSSESKFESHCGWPSFDAAISKRTVKEIIDKSFGMIRTEIVCATCEGHLGHVFNDGPTETGVRYCINSVSLEFEKEN